jgi:hypothetical protein
MALILPSRGRPYPANAAVGSGVTRRWRRRSYWAPDQYLAPEELLGTEPAGDVEAECVTTGHGPQVRFKRG